MSDQATTPAANDDYLSVAKQRQEEAKLLELKDDMTFLEAEQAIRKIYTTSPIEVVTDASGEFRTIKLTLSRQSNYGDIEFHLEIYERKAHGKQISLFDLDTGEVATDESNGMTKTLRAQITGTNTDIFRDRGLTLEKAVTHWRKKVKASFALPPPTKLKTE